MLKLEALVKPLVIDELLKQLIDIGVHSVSYSEIYAANRPLFHAVPNKDVPQDVSFIPHIKLEVIVDEERLSAIQDALAEKVSTPLAHGAEVIVIRLKEGVRVSGTVGSDPEIEEI